MTESPPTTDRDIDSDVYVLVFVDYGVRTKETLNGLCPKDPRRDLWKVLRTPGSRDLEMSK